MKQKTSILKVIVYLISIIGFIDLIINPKPIAFFNSMFGVLTSLLTIMGLFILIVKEVLKNTFQVFDKILKPLKIILLLLLLLNLNAFLKRFGFVQKVEYIIVALYFLPVIWIFNDVLATKIKAKVLALAGLILLIPTSIYFLFIYEPYEAFASDGTPIMFLHQHIRNWICYIGIALILISILRVRTNNNSEFKA